ncbi:MAG: GAF domain-containing protein [Spirochaetales bacterium]|nr:GAF domain-containing protein [Spirochaetales bacterium]
MGVILMKYFQDAFNMGGIPARVALTRYSNMSSLTAKTIEDSEENIRIYENAMIKIKAEFSGQNVLTGAESVATSAAGVSELNKVLADLNNKKPLFISSLESTMRNITEAASHALNIARVSVWFYDEGLTAIKCENLYEQSVAKHSSGMILSQKDFPAYFQALERDRAIDAHDANKDPRTSCFSGPYLSKLGITSLLDIPIWHNNKMKGVLCQEHIGPIRTWTPEEADFGVDLAKFITEALSK